MRPRHPRVPLTMTPYDTGLLTVTHIDIALDHTFDLSNNCID